MVEDSTVALTSASFTKWTKTKPWSHEENALFFKVPQHQLVKSSRFFLFWLSQCQSHLTPSNGDVSDIPKPKSLTSVIVVFFKLSLFSC